MPGPLTFTNSTGGSSTVLNAPWQRRKPRSHAVYPNVPCSGCRMAPGDSHPPWLPTLEIREALRAQRMGCRGTDTDRRASSARRRACCHTRGATHTAPRVPSPRGYQIKMQWRGVPSRKLKVASHAVYKTRGRSEGRFIQGVRRDRFLLL